MKGIIAVASITLQNLVKKFGETVTAVAGVDLEVSDGEFMVVVVGRRAAEKPPRST